MGVSKKKDLVPVAKKSEEKKGKSKVINNLIRLTFKIVIFGSIYYVFFGMVFGVLRMETSFMSPSITEGDLLVYYRMDKEINLGDVVVINNNNKKGVYRIVAKEGQTIDIDKQGLLLIDGYPEEHQAFYEIKVEEDDEFQFPFTVESGKYFVMNDYRFEKKDSRTFGTIDKDSIIGKIIGRLQIRNI